MNGSLNAFEIITEGCLFADAQARETTLAQAIAEYLDHDVGALVKTMEAPRDLQLDGRITQYAPLEGDLEKTAEIIFLVRPDFVIFDEVRRARDFKFLPMFDSPALVFWA